MSTSMPGPDAGNISTPTQAIRSAAIVETTDDSILVRLPEWLTAEQVAEIKKAMDDWFQSAVHAARERQEEGR